MKPLVALALLSASLLMPAAGWAQVASEYEIKAAFIYNFTSFVDWPGHDSQDRSPFVIGIVGKDPFGRAIDDAMRSKSVRGREIAIKRWESAKDLGTCDLLFVSSSETDNMELIQKGLGRSAVLTVIDQPGFILRGGIISFVKEDGKVRFDINADAARRSGLVVSSRLLGLARTTKDDKDVAAGR